MRVFFLFSFNIRRRVTKQDNFRIENVHIEVLMIYKHFFKGLCIYYLEIYIILCRDVSSGKTLVVECSAL